MRNNLLSNWECFVRVNEYNAVTEVGIGGTVDDGDSGISVSVYRVC